MSLRNSGMAPRSASAQPDPEESSKVGPPSDWFSPTLATIEVTNRMARMATEPTTRRLVVAETARPKAA